MNDEIRELRRKTDAAVQQSTAMRAALQRSVDRLACQVGELATSQQALMDSVEQLQEALEDRI